MWGTTPIAHEIETSEAWECHGKGVASQFYVGRGRAWFRVYEKREKPTRVFQEYSQESRREFAKRHASLKLTESLCLRDVYLASHSCGIADIGEGLMPAFSWKRCVLVGDAAYQLTPSDGLELNSGIQDIVVLANELKRLTQESKVELLGTEAIQSVFRAYESARRDEAEACVALSARAMRAQAWDTWPLWLWDRYILPMLGGSRAIFKKTLSPIISKGRVLELLEERDHCAGSVPWVHAANIRRTSRQ
jgi:2-polyprenyl-6-methoxyphenol hydroxylase-like FAD-dependent oxidoreductase